jgi:hypothetical protein
LRRYTLVQDITKSAAQDAQKELAELMKEATAAAGKEAAEEKASKAGAYTRPLLSST